MPDADNFPRRAGFHYGSGMSTEKSTGLRFGVLPRIVVAIALGILLGSLLTHLGHPDLRHLATTSSASS